MDTSTEQGRQKRIEELANDYKARGNGFGLVRIIGGSIAEYDTRFENSDSHPDERLEANQ